MCVKKALLKTLPVFTRIFKPATLFTPIIKVKAIKIALEVVQTKMGPQKIVRRVLPKTRGAGMTITLNTTLLVTPALHGATTHASLYKVLWVTRETLLGNNSKYFRVINNKITVFLRKRSEGTSVAASDIHDASGGIAFRNTLRGIVIGNNNEFGVSGMLLDRGRNDILNDILNDSDILTSGIGHNRRDLGRICDMVGSIGISGKLRSEVPEHSHNSGLHGVC